MKTESISRERLGHGSSTPLFVKEPILERRGLEAGRRLLRLANVPASDIHVTVISYEEQIRDWTAAIAATKNTSAQVMQGDVYRQRGSRSRQF